MLDLPSCTKENFLFSGIKHNADDSIGFSNLTQLLGILGWASSFYPGQFCVVLLNDRHKKQTFHEVQRLTVVCTVTISVYGAGEAVSAFDTV